MGAEEPGPHWANHLKTENFSAVQDETFWVQDYKAAWHIAVHTKTRETGTKPSGSVRDEEIQRKDTEQECARGWKRKKTRGSIRALTGGKKNRKAADEFGWYCRLWWLYQKSTTVSPQAQACTFLVEKVPQRCLKSVLCCEHTGNHWLSMPCMCNFSYPMNLTDLLRVQVKYCLITFNTVLTICK